MMAFAVCGCGSGDTVPVPVADGGKVVLREFDRSKGGTVSAVLRDGDDYGVMLVNEAKSEEEPMMMVVVARRHPAEVYRVHSLDELEAVLRTFPAGAEFHEYDRCLVPAGYGLPEDTWAKVKEVVRRCGHRLDDGKGEDSGVRTTCTCPV